MVALLGQQWKFAVFVSVATYIGGFFVLDPRLLIILAVASGLISAGVVLLSNVELKKVQTIGTFFGLWVLTLILLTLIFNYIVGYPVFVVKSVFVTR